LRLKAFRRNITYTAIDVDRLMLDDPLLSRKLTEDVLALIEAAALPPVPVTIYDYADYMSAFRSMQKGTHVGKLVLSRVPTSASPTSGDADLTAGSEPQPTKLRTIQVRDLTRTTAGCSMY
jgi:hypothetical protein